MIFWSFGNVFLMYLMISSVVTSGNDPKIICTGHLHAIVTSGDNLRSVGRQMHPQLFRIAARKQRILCWKLGRGCHCGSNGSIYSFSFFVPSFFFFFFFVVVIVVVVFHPKTCVFIISNSFCDEVSDFRSRVLTNGKPELVIRNYQ